MLLPPSESDDVRLRAPVPEWIAAASPAATTCHESKRNNPNNPYTHRAALIVRHSIQGFGEKLRKRKQISLHGSMPSLPGPV
jgi:hypothetical protein